MANKVIGRYCATAKKGTIIMPKEIAGYTSPEGQVLTENGQQFVFKYTPIVYSIGYNLNGGSFNGAVTPWSDYTVEKSYTPPTPVFEDHTFAGWTPSSIELGTTGPITFEAAWTDNAILLTGALFNEAINNKYGKENVIGIQIASKVPEDIKTEDIINISSTSAPIFAWHSSTDGILYIYSLVDIWCNFDMTGAFEGFSILRDISALATFKTKENMTITNLFKGCKLLTDATAIEKWANGKFSDFRGAFEGTPALESGRVPSWFKWDVTIRYISTTGKVLESATRSCIPDQTLYSKIINGYEIITNSLVIDDPNKTYDFMYKPIEYSISYSLDGGSIYNAKYVYTIEDGKYCPPNAIKDGYTFVKWNPECIEAGDYGNITFIAEYKKD